MTIHKSLNTTLVLSIILVGLLAYSFLKADWTPPPANPPANNVDAPINVGATYQAKTGDLGAVKMRAGAYCDALGENCLSNPSGEAVIRQSCSPNQLTCQQILTRHHRN